MGYRSRLVLLAVLSGLGGTVLVSRLFAMQVVARGASREAAEKQVADWRPVHSARGRILDRNGKELAAEEAGYELVVRTAAWRAVMHECIRCGLVRFYPAGTEAKNCTRCKTKHGLVAVDRSDVTTIARLLGISAAELLDRVETRVREAEAAVQDDLADDLPPRQREQQERALRLDHGWRPRRIARDVPYEVAREVELNPHANPAFRIRAVHARRSTGGRDFVHLLGQVRQEPVAVAGADLKAEMTVGVSGVEAALDRELRGEPGWIRILIDPRDGEARVVERHPPRHGVDVRLTIAAEDQARAVAALGAATGALIVIDAETGDVLAAATAPGYEPSDYARILGEQQEAHERTRRWPKHSVLRDAAFDDFDLPGSIVKPMTAVAALVSGIATPETRLACDRLFRNRRGQVLPSLRCSHEHGEVDLREALVRSCNVYFQTLQRETIEGGVFDRFFDVSRRFGFGLPTGIELEPTPFPDRYDPGRTWAEHISMAIGQGEVKLSPAQVARAYAGLFTGALPRLRLVAETGGRPVPPQRTPLGIDDAALRPVREALLDVARRGTAAGFGLERWPVALKTGTAQLGRLDLQNAWLAGFLPAHRGRPAVAFAMVLFDTEQNGAEACAPRLAEFLRGFYGEGRE